MKINAIAPIVNTKSINFNSSYSAANTIQTDIFVRQSHPNFKGTDRLISEEERQLAKSKLDASKREYSADNNVPYFSDVAKNNILSALTPKNIVFLDRILKLNNSKLTDQHIVEMLKYIDSIDENEAKYKIEKLENLPSMIVKSLGTNLLEEKYNGNFFDRIGNNTYTILLKSDLLTDEDQSSSFAIACNKLKKYIGSGNNEELTPNSKSRQLEAARYFGEILLAGSMVSSSVFEDLLYNRENPINSVAKRISTLEMDDVYFIRKLAKNAVNFDSNDEVRPLSNSEIIKLINLVAHNRILKNEGYKGLDLNDPKYKYTTEYLEPSFVVNIDQIQHDLLPLTLETNGIDKRIIKEYMKKYDIALEYSQEYDTKPSKKVFWDTDYVYLLKGTHHNSPLKNIIREMTTQTALSKDNPPDTRQIFLDYITKSDNIYAERNRKTKQIFEDNQIDYENWISDNQYEIKSSYTSKLTPWRINGKTLTAKMWARIPQESLFDGNYTTCCTALDEEHGNSFPYYLLGTFANVIEVKNERNEIVGMSRILMAKVDEQPSLIIENMEVKNKTKNRYLHNDSAVKTYRNMIFHYANTIAKSVNKDKNRTIPVYFTNSWPKIPGVLDGLKTVGTKKVEILGSAPDGIYINTYKYDFNLLDSGEDDKIVFSTSGLIDVTEHD